MVSPGSDEQEMGVEKQRLISDPTFPRWAAAETHFQSSALRGESFLGELLWDEVGAQVRQFNNWSAGSGDCRVFLPRRLKSPRPEERKLIVNSSDAR